jgi:chromosome partitioning protein
MTKTISIVQRKGGVGKSTGCLNLACAFAERGLRVLIIDLDDQQNATRSISALASPLNETPASSGNIEDLFLKDEINLKDVVVETGWKNVMILPASNNLSGVVKYLDSEIGAHLILKEKLSKTNQFDMILIDTSPSQNILVVNALCASDYMLIPLSSKYLSMQGLSQTLASFKKINSRLNPDIKLLGIAFVNHDKRNVLANEIVEQVKEKYANELFKTIIGINIKIEEAQVNKESILTYSPEDRGAMQYRELGTEILTRILEAEHE